MKTFKITFFLLTTVFVLTFSLSSNAQLNMTVNSLADDEYSYAWDDPATPEDESIDGICKDELGRCTIRAAIDESNNLSQSLNLSFSVNGQINLIDFLYPVDGSHISGNGQVEITGPFSFQVENGCRFENLIFNQMQYEAIAIYGDTNFVGIHNTFKYCGIGVDVWGNQNTIWGNYFGVDINNNLGTNGISILVTGSYNNIRLNSICGSTTGISIAEGHQNEIVNNLIGIPDNEDSTYGNNIGISIAGSGSNLIGGDYMLDANIISGNKVAGISISGVPPDDFSEFNIILNNIIGLNSDETKAIPNANGIVISNATRFCGIGQNIIAGNALSGIHIFGDALPENKTYGHLIENNKIGINRNGVIIPNRQNGINIMGNVDNVSIGTDFTGSYVPNTIVGNLGRGIWVSDEFNIAPSKITFRGNILFQNNLENLFVSALSNQGITPPYSLSFSNNTIAGISDFPGALIDVYRANINEFSPSAYEWLGSTTVGSNGVFSYEITNPSIEAVSLTATDNNGNTSGFAFIELITDVEKENDEIPTEYALYQNYPNPFNPSTTISFSIPSEEYVVLTVFNSLGEEIAELINETKPAGNYSVSFDASGLSSGIYFYKLSAGSISLSKKMTVLK